MPRSRDLLARYRPVGAPGAAAPAGVPADRAAELGRELRPVFDELAATEEEASRIRAHAATEAAARGAAAQEQAQAILDSARRDAEGARAEAAAAVLRQVEEDAVAIQAAADEEAVAITARARTRLPELVARVVDAVRGDQPLGSTAP